MSKAINTSLTPGERLIWSGRTHFKILIKPVFVQLLLLAAHWLVIAFVPSNTGWDWWDSWGPLSLHLIILVVEIWYVLVPILRWLNGSFEVTSERVIKHWGVIQKHSREIPLDRIVSVSVERGIVDRIFSCGTIIFQDAASEFQPITRGAWNRSEASSQYGIRFYDVPNVLEVQSIIDTERFKRKHQ